MSKRILQILLAALAGLVLFEVGPGTLFSFGPILSAHSEAVIFWIAILSLGTPKRIMWLTLAVWAFYFGWWSVYELVVLTHGDLKFGPMLIPYGIGGLVFAIASWLSRHGRGGTVHLRKPFLLYKNG